MKAILTAVLTLWLAGCASTSSVMTRYASADSATALSHLLVVARTPEQPVRARWESVCRDTFTAGTATASHDPLPGWFDSGHQQPLQWLAATHPHGAVLIVDLTALLLPPMQMPAHNEVSRERFPGDHTQQQDTFRIEFGSSGSKDARAPEDTLTTEARLVLANGDIAWDAVISTREANDLAAIARSQCRALDKTLRRLGWLP